MATKLNAMICESAATGTKEHEFQWADQSTNDHGPLAIVPRYGSFTGASFTVDGNTNTSTTIDNLTSTGRIVAGMTITGTDIPGGTTVSSVDSGTAITISQAATGTTAGVTFTFNAAAAAVTDPVIQVGYNCDSGGTEIETGKGQAFMQIEGHYDRGASGDAWMEAFFGFDIDGSSGQARPFFFSYDKEARKPKSIQVSPGVDESLTINFENFSGDSGGAGFAFSEGILDINAPPKKASNDTALRMGSNSGQLSQLIMTANAEAVTAPSFKIFVEGVGGSLQHKNAYVVMQDNAAGSAKTGRVSFRADDTASIDSILFNVGASSPQNDAMVEFDSTNMPTNYPTFKITAKASQTRGVIEVDGINNGTGAVEERTWSLHPEGYCIIRESGNTTTDRNPGTGASTITPAWTNKPGSGTSGTATWFPMLDTSGALFWVPGFAD